MVIRKMFLFICPEHGNAIGDSISASRRGSSVKEVSTMDYYQVPLGFGMALARNFNAMNAYSAMTDEQKKAVLDRAHKARSEQEMSQIVNSLVHIR